MDWMRQCCIETGAKGEREGRRKCRERERKEEKSERRWEGKGV